MKPKRRKKISRREAISTATKIAGGVVAGAVIGGVVGYLVKPGVAPETTTITVEKTKTVTQTVTQTVGTTVPTTVVTTPSPTKTVTTTPSPTPTTAVAGYRHVTPDDTLVIWRCSMISREAEEAYEKVERDFEKKTGIKVKVELIDETSLPPKVQTAFLTGVIPVDLIFYTQTPYVARWAVQGWLRPIDEFFDWWLSNYGDDIVEAYRHSQVPGPDGEPRYYMVGIGPTVGLWHVRADWVKAAGYELEDLEGPFEKFEEVLYAMRKVIPEDSVPLFLQIGTSSPGDGSGAFWNFVRTFQDALEYDFTKKEYVVSESAIAKLYEKLYKWIQDGIVNKSMPTATEYDNNNVFQMGKAGCTQNTLSIWKWLSENKPDWLDPENPKLGLAKLPPLSASGKRWFTIGWRVYSVPVSTPDSKYKKCIEFLKYFFSPEVYDEWFKANVGDRLDAGIYKHNAEQPPVTEDPLLMKVQEAANEAVGIGPSDLMPALGAFNADMIGGQGYLKVHIGVASPDEAAEWVVSQLESYVKKYEKEIGTKVRVLD